MTKRARPLRWRLVLLVCAAITPLALLSATSVGLLAYERRAQAQAETLNLARALVASVDNDLLGALRALEVVATSGTLDSDAYDVFSVRVRRVAATQPNWLSIDLADPAGRILLSSNPVTRTARQSVVERESFDALLRSRRPVVGALMPGPHGAYAFAARAPVIRDGQLRYVLSAVLRPREIAGLLQRQHVPTNWVVSVFDAHGARVARSPVVAGSIGGRPAPSLEALMRGRSEGVGLTSSIEGVPVYTAFARSPVTGWTVAVGVPPPLVFAGFQRSLLVYGGGLVLSLLLGLSVAVTLSRGILQPTRSLSRAAEALGRGGQLELPPFEIAELQSVAQALASAAERQRAVAAQRARLYEVEHEARAQAEAANRAKDAFLAMLGHELRNPLAPIVTALALMERRDPHAFEMERQVLRRQVNHLKRLVDDLLDMARLMHGKLDMQMDVVDLREIARHALEQVQAMFPKGAPIRVELPPVPVVVHGDTVRLTQVFANLLGNAAKFTPLDGRISLAMQAHEREVEVRVEDEGQGMAAELVPQVFGLFVQGPQDFDRPLGGLGLGLAIVQAIVQLHGGRVAAASEGEGRGSCFTVWLPLAQARAGAERAEAP
jgi:signal transduction histidine kinase